MPPSISAQGHPKAPQGVFSRRRALTTAGVALAGSVLAACRAGDGARQAQGGRPGTPLHQPVTIEYLFQSDVLWEKDKLLLDPFREKAPHITITPLSGGFDKLKVLLASGTPPDSAWLNIIHVPLLAEQGALLAVDHWLARDWKAMEGDDIYPGAWEAVTWKGKRYGTPFEANPFLPVFRPDFFDEAGLPYPTKLAEQGTWTWEAVVETAKRLTRRSPEGKPERFGLQLRTDPYSLFHWIWNNGGEVWNADRTECLLNQPPAVEAIQFMQDLFVRHRVAPLGTEARDLSGTSFNDMRSGLIAFEWQYSGGGSLMGGVVDFPFLVAPEPQGRAPRLQPHMNGSGNSIIAGARQPEAAWTWITFVAGKEADVVLMRTGRTPPRRRSGEDYYVREVKYPPNGKVLTEMARIARMTPAVPQWPEFQTILTRELGPVWLGQRAPREALDALVRQVNVLLRTP